jgi:restriction system protein
MVQCQGKFLVRLRGGGGSMELVFGIVLLGIFAALILRAAGVNKQAEAEARQKRQFDDNWRALYEHLNQVMDETIAEHLPTLAKKAKQKIYSDDYGTLVMDQWEKEMEYFSKSVIIPELQLESYRYKKDNNIGLEIEVEITLEEIVAAIDLGVQPLLDGDEIYELDEDISGTEFEQLCSDLLRESGWDARATKATGDQGVDIIAQREGLTVVLQCKRYSSPVGNRAVQEAFSGKEFEDADYAAVVSNADYTTAARQLANKNGVLLIHYDDLPNLWEQISRSESR